MSRQRYQGSDAWLEERRGGYGSSDVPVLVDGDEKAWRELHARKLGILPEQEQSETMAWGHRLEDVIAHAYTERTGEALVRVDRVLRHRELDFVRASLDRRTRRGRKVVEIKKWGWKTDDFGREGSDQVPDRFLWQVQQQLAVTGYDAADLAVLFGGRELTIYRLGADRSLIDELLELETAAWAFVARGEMPPWPGQAPTRLQLAADEVAADEVLVELAGLYEAADDRARQAEAFVDEIKQRIRDVMADVGGAKGAMPDGRRLSISHRPQEPARRTAWDRVAAAYRQMLQELAAGVPGVAERIADRDPDTVESMFTTTQPGPRPLRISIGKESRKHAA